MEMQGKSVHPFGDFHSLDFPASTYLFVRLAHGQKLISNSHYGGPVARNLLNTLSIK